MIVEVAGHKPFLLHLTAGVDEVCFEYVPGLLSPEERSESRSSERSVAGRASLVWIGDSDDRPRYFGQATTTQLTAKMDSALWTYVRGKQMDEKMFRALVRRFYLDFIPPLLDRPTNIASVNLVNKLQKVFISLIQH